MEKKVDESWKEQVEREKRLLQPGGGQPQARPAPPDAGRAEPQRAAVGGGGPRGTTAGGRPSGAGGRGGQEMPETDFSFFLSSLSMQALVALGEIPHPATNLPQENLEQARYFIDLLGVLQEKTKGNLTPEEGSLLEQVVYELRMKYVARTEGPGVP